MYGVIIFIFGPEYEQGIELFSVSYEKTFFLNIFIYMMDEKSTVFSSFFVESQFRNLQ